MREFGRGFDVRNLRYMRQFYPIFPAHRALGQESGHGKKRNAARFRSATANIRNAARSESSGFEAGIHHAASDESVRPALRTELSWTHYRLLLRVEKPQAREWYMHEAADQNWSSRQLDRQISVLYFFVGRLLFWSRSFP